MENAHKVNFFTKITVPVLCGVLALINFGSLSVTAAKAEAPGAPKRVIARKGKLGIWTRGTSLRTTGRLVS